VERPSDPPVFLDFEEENTVAIPDGTLSALLAETGDGQQTTPMPPISAVSSEIRPRDASFHTIPDFPEGPVAGRTGAAVESNIHQIEGGRIVDSLARSDAESPYIELPLTVSNDAAAIPLTRARARQSVVRNVISALSFLAIAIAIGVFVANELSPALKAHGIDLPAIGNKWLALAKDKLPWLRGLLF
jgi:hypothetical protein